MIAALFVEKNGVYCGLDNVDPWTIERDARKYAGPWPVVAHPPCERWGRYWSGGPSAKVRRKLGGDNGCFWEALLATQRYGGILEHPEASHAFKRFALGIPPREGCWVQSSYPNGGWICCVEQGHYGHPARKATWLFTTHPNPPELIWGPSKGQRLDEGFHSAAERKAARASGQPPRKRLSRKENLATPIAFRDLLISIAEDCKK